MKMNKKKVELEDGRYLIYYEFEDEGEKKEKEDSKSKGDQKS